MQKGHNKKNRACPKYRETMMAAGEYVSDDDLDGKRKVLDGSLILLPAY